MVNDDATHHGDGETPQTDALCGSFSLRWGSDDKIAALTDLARLLERELTDAQMRLMRKAEEAAELASRVAPSAGESVDRQQEAADISRILKEQRRAASSTERDYLISCPWCGEQMNSRPISAQMSHVIGCGDKRIAEARCTPSSIRRGSAVEQGIVAIEADAVRGTNHPTAVVVFKEGAWDNRDAFVERINQGEFWVTTGRHTPPEAEHVYCHECSKAGGGDAPIHHEAPACAPSPRGDILK